MPSMPSVKMPSVKLPKVRLPFAKRDRGEGEYESQRVEATRVAPIRIGSSRPNIIFFLVDDLGWSDLPCYGNPFHLTPNIDKLARKSVRFSQAYAASAVCSPSRAAIQTGKHPARLRMTDWIPGRERQFSDPMKTPPARDRMSLSERTIAEALKQGGYQTGFVGKWHLGGENYEPHDQGYKYNAGGGAQGSPSHPNYYRPPFDMVNLKNKRDDEYLTDRLTDEAQWQLNQFQKKSDQPFFLMMSYYNVHEPIQAKPGMADKYFDRRKDGSPWKNEDYAACLESVDQSVGRILGMLQRQGLEKDTLIVFTSDNGGAPAVTSNYPLRGTKSDYYEGGIRVPLLVSWPARLRPGVTEAAVTSMDFYPTFLEAANIAPQPEQHLDGKSMMAAFAGRDVHQKLFWHYPHYNHSGVSPLSAMRSGNLKLIRNYESNSLELYDLNRDPREQNNLAASQKSVAYSMARDLGTWLEYVDASMPVMRDKGAPVAAQKHNNTAASQFSQVIGARVSQDAKGYYHISADNFGCALKPYRPMAGKRFEISCDFEILSKKPAQFENASIVVGESSENLFSFTYWKGRKTLTISRFGELEPIAEVAVTNPPKKGAFRLTVEIDEREVGVSAGDTMLKKKLGRPMQIRTIGYGVLKASVKASDFAIKAS